MSPGNVEATYVLRLESFKVEPTPMLSDARIELLLLIEASRNPAD